MKIAIASGKGGTGKTTVSLALAETLGNRARLFDCDVEEPNCHLFINAQPTHIEPVNVLTPEFDLKHCLGCGKCAQHCHFNAIAAVKQQMIHFAELCHGCGNCVLNCPANAIARGTRQIGRLEFCNAANFELISGVAQIGSSMSPPVIRQLKRHADRQRINLFDAPPGTACAMTAAVDGCDYVILVTEPTPFGLHDLQLAIQTLKMMNLRFGVIVNRADPQVDIIGGFCRQQQIKLLMQIAFSRRIAEGYSRGQRLLQAAPELKAEFETMLKGLGAI